MLSVAVTFFGLIGVSLSQGPDGCSGTAVESIEIVPQQIYACSGTFNGGGTWGAAAGLLCSNGYSVCRSATRAAELGMTKTLCNDNNLFTDPNQFFGTAETSIGWLKCYSENPGTPFLGRYNDIWGCANSNLPLQGSRVYGSPGADCQDGIGDVILDRAIGNGDVLSGTWVLGSSTTTEAKGYSLIDSSGGGVLCCVDDGVCDDRTDTEECMSDDDCNIAGSDCMICCATGKCHRIGSPAAQMADGLMDINDENPVISAPKPNTHNKINYNGYYNIMIGGFILFILINNVFICYWCVCKDNYKRFYQNVKVDSVEFNEQ